MPRPFFSLGSIYFPKKCLNKHFSYNNNIISFHLQITAWDQKGFTTVSPSPRKWNKKEKNKWPFCPPPFSSSKKYNKECERQTPSYYHHNPFVRFIGSFYFFFLSGQVQPDFQLMPIFLSRSPHRIGAVVTYDLFASGADPSAHYLLPVKVKSWVWTLNHFHTQKCIKTEKKWTKYIKFVH